MIFKDDAGNQLPLEVQGWTPFLQPKARHRVLENQAFEAGAHQAPTSPLNTLPEPSQAQKVANTYRKAHVTFQGLPLAIENPRGSVREGKGWRNIMAHHYGYLPRTSGADGEGLDVFVGPELDSELVTVVNQVDPRTRKFDEHKIMLGFSSEDEARRGYLASYEPGWQGLGSSWTCDMEDLKAWLASGNLTEPAGGRQVRKAGDEAGVRWITIHPHGDKSEPGHPCKIMAVPGHPGVYHVTGGMDGKLNGLRLQGIKSPEEYRKESKERSKANKKAREAKRQAKDAMLTDEEREQRAGAATDAEDRVKQAKEHLIRTTLRAQGIDPEKAMELPGVDNKLAQAKHSQELLSHAMKAAKEAERKISMDPEVRARAGVAQVGGDNQPTVDEVLSLTDKEKGPGYQRAIKERATEAGMTAEKLADSVQELRQKQADARVAEGDFTERHEELGDGDPALGIQIAGQIMGELNRKAHMTAKALKESANGAIKESLKQADTDNEQYMAILRARKVLREAQKALKKGKACIFEQGYQSHIEDMDESIIQDAANSLRTERMEAFLSEVAEAHPEDQETMDLATVPNEDGLQASRGAGAFDGLHEVALAAMGQGALDRETVEVLGPEGAAQILARALRKVYTPADQAELMKALEEVHLEEQDKELPEVMEEVSRLRADAAKVQEEIADTPRDLATAAEMQRNKVDMLKEARRQLGGFLGRTEARAALLLAMKEAPRAVMTVPLGKVGREQAVMTAAALGLKEGQFSLDYDKGEGLLTLNEKGQEALIRPYDQVADAERTLAVSLKRGEQDEDGWLPTGFARRTEIRADNPLLEPPIFRKAFAPEGAQDEADLKQSVEDYIGARYADGDRATDILMALNNPDAAGAVPEQLQGAYRDLVRAALPLREVVTDKDGKEVYDEDEVTGEKHLRTKSAQAGAVDAAAQKMAEGFLDRHGIDGDKAFYAQRANIDGPEFAESLHQALAKDPRTAAGFIPVGELTSDQQRNVRDYFYDTFHGGERGSGGDVGPEPEKMEMDMFGEASTTPAWLEWKERKDNAGSLWAKYVETMGGLKDAQAAVQAHMAGKALQHFADHYGRATGQKFKLGQAQIPAGEEFIKATGTPEEREQARAERQAETEALRRRGPAGQYSEGSVNDIRQEHRARAATMQAEAGSMFDLDEFTEEKPAPELEDFNLKPCHRLSLGPALESQLHQVMPGALKALQGQRRAMKLGPVAMSGQYAPQQRGIKAVTQLKRVGLFYSAGSGKTPIMLGAHAELAKAGKVKKAIYSVPSAVQAQFGSEAASFLDPKSGLYIHANPGETFQERLAAYKDPEIHGVVVTHQALRDDTLKVLGEAKGIKDHDKLVDWVRQAPRAELAAAVKDAWAAAGVDSQALFLDEGHNALNRAGKEDSTLAKVIDAMGDNATYYAAATADPIKNDPSEAFDWLRKMDPKRYPAERRDEWMRRFGKNTPLMRRSMKAELARYYFTARVDPKEAAANQGHNIELTREIQTAPVTDSQRQALDAVDKAMAGLAFAKTPEERAAAAKVLDPDADPELVAKARGTFKEAAYNRIINMDPKGGKVQKTVELAKQSVADGKPAVVFARNHDSIHAIEAAMQEAGIPCTTLTGKHGADVKAERIEKFQPKQGEPQAQVIIMSDAGATGINLQRGQTVIHHDIPNTSMIHTQRTARCWRLKQTNNVSEYTVAADHPFDHNNLRRLRRKEYLSSIYKSAEGSMDDTGTAERIRAVRERAKQAMTPTPAPEAA